MTVEQDKFIMRVIERSIADLERGLEDRLVEFARGYIDAQRKGTLMRNDYCCEEFSKMARGLWETTSRLAADWGGGIYDQPGAPHAIQFRGHGFNYCPFCGEKL